MNNLKRTQTTLIRLMNFSGKQLFIIIALMQCMYAHNSIGQSKLDHAIQLDMRYHSVSSLIQKLETDTDLQLTYSLKKIDGSQLIFLEKGNTTAQNLLANISAQSDIKYELYGDRYIVLSPKKEVAPYQEIGIYGTVKGSDGQPLQFANVVVLDQSGTLIDGSFTDEYGRFNIDVTPPGKYTVDISYLGFNSYQKVVDHTDKTDLGTITLEEDTNMLSEVQIVERRKLIKQKIDRLEVDVENSMLASRGDALEVLRSTPGINVINNNISMIGKSAMGVMINGKIVNLTGDDLNNYLRGISSEDILKIEVITTPPARYAAQGNSGLINIILKSARLNSWNAQIYGGLTQQTHLSGNVGGSYMYNKDRFSLSGSVFAIDGKYYQEQVDYAHFDDGLWYTSSPLTNDYERLNARLDLSYDLTDRWSLGGQVVRNHGRLNVTDAPYLPVFDYQTDEILRYLQSDESYIKQEPIFYSYNLNNSMKLDTSGSLMTVNLDYFTYDNPDNRFYKGISVINGSDPSTQYYIGENINNQKIENTSLSVDMDVPTSWADLSIGAKLTRSVTNNDISLFNSGLVDNKIDDYTMASNDFSYREDIGALYLSAFKNLSKQWTAKAGVRAEYTKTGSISNNLGLDQDDDYLRIFPTAYINYQHAESTSFNLSYSFRINRPTFLQLNPNIYFINPFQSIKGNAFITPSFTNNLELGYSWGSLNGKVYYSRERDAFDQVPLADESDNSVVFIYQNYVDNDIIGFAQYYTYDKLYWWTSVNSFNINRTLSVFDLDEEHDDFTGRNISLSTSNDFTPSKNSNWGLNVSFTHAFRGTRYIYTTLPASNLSASIQYKALDNNLRISLQASDILKTSADRFETTVNGVFQTARYYYDSRQVRLTVSYRFGNKDIIAKKIKTGNEDEKGRAGN